MIYIFKSISHSRLLPVLLLSALLFFSGAFYTAGNADAASSSDTIRSGKMDSHSNNYIVVDNVRYSFCSGMQIFTKIGVKIPLTSLHEAINVELYENNGCVEKITVLSFAQ